MKHFRLFLTMLLALICVKSNAKPADSQIGTTKRVISPFTPRVVDSTGRKVYVHPNPQDRNRRFIVDLGYGISALTSKNSFANRVTNMDMSTHKSLKGDIDGSMGVLYIGVGYEVNPWLTISLQFVYSNGEGYVPELYRYNRMKDTWYSILPTIRISWMRSRHFAIYSRFSAGYTLGNREVNTTSYTAGAFGYQISPIGFEYSHKWFGLFVEGGYGMTGFGNAGIRFKFNKGRDGIYSAPGGVTWEQVGQ